MDNRPILVILIFAALSPTWLAALPSAVGTSGYVSGTAQSQVAPSTASRVNVAIQAGHWKSAELPDILADLRGSTGTRGGGRTEPELTLDIAQRVAKMLRAKGLTVEILPATVPTGYQADLFISLHADGSSSASARGYKVSTRWRSDVAAMDAMLVQSIEDGYSAVTKLPQDSNITRAMRGYYAYSSYRGEEYRLSSTTPAAIVEMGFMTNASDRVLMFNNPDKIAGGVVAGVDNFYARRDTAMQLQAEASKEAALSSFGRSAVVLMDGVNIRSDADTSAARVAGANFGDSFPLQQASNSRPPGGQFDPKQGTQVITGIGWYKISVPGVAGDVYISRDTVVVQQ